MFFEEKFRLIDMNVLPNKALGGHSEDSVIGKLLRLKFTLIKDLLDLTNSQREALIRQLESKRTAINGINFFVQTLEDCVKDIEVGDTPNASSKIITLIDLIKKLI